MLVKYRMLSTITSANFIADIVGILDGSITSTSGLSAGADKTNSSFTGTYPTGAITKVNGTSYTFSKVHNADNTYTHYFRLTFGSSVLSTFTVAQGYTSGTDTLLNSVAQTVNVTPITYNSAEAFSKGIIIVINPKCVYISGLANGITFGLFDVGANGITNTYTNSMKMAYVSPSAGTFNIPYTYSLAGGASGYSSLSGSLTNLQLPAVKSNSSGQGVVIENPTFLSHTNQGYQAFGIYNLFKLGQYNFNADSIYNTAGTPRAVSVNDYAIVSE